MQAASTFPAVFNPTTERIPANDSGCKKASGVALAVAGLAFILIGSGYAMAAWAVKNPNYQHQFAYWSYGTTVAGIALGLTGLGLLCSRVRTRSAESPANIINGGVNIQLAPPVVQPEISSVIAHHVPSAGNEERFTLQIPGNMIPAFRPGETPRWPPTVQEQIRNPFRHGFIDHSVSDSPNPSGVIGRNSELNTEFSFRDLSSVEAPSAEPLSVSIHIQSSASDSRST